MTILNSKNGIKNGEERYQTFRNDIPPIFETSISDTCLCRLWYNLRIFKQVSEILVRFPTPHRRFLVRPLRVVSAVGKEPLRTKETNGK